MSSIYEMSNGDLRTMSMQKQQLTDSSKSLEESDSGIHVSPVPVSSRDNSETQANSNEDIKSVELLNDEVEFQNATRNESIIAIKEFLPPPTITTQLNKDDAQESLYDPGYQVFSIWSNQFINESFT